MKLYFFAFLLAHKESQRFIEVTGEVYSYDMKGAHADTVAYAGAAMTKSNVRGLFLVGVQIQECVHWRVGENV